MLKKKKTVDLTEADFFKKILKMKRKYLTFIYVQIEKYVFIKVNNIKHPKRRNQSTILIL